MALMQRPRPDPFPAKGRRRGLPLFPTLLTILAVALMVGLGLWQLQRMRWKDALLAEMAAAASAPLRDLGDAAPRSADAFRLVRAVVRCRAQPPVERGGRNRDGASGYATWLLCEAGGAPLWLDIGWHPRPGSPDAAAAARRLADGKPAAMTGVIAPTETREARFRLVVRDGVAPLRASAPPDMAEIPNNHLAYAIQWFAFAAVAMAVWAVYLRRWRQAGADKLARPDRGR